MALWLLETHRLRQGPDSLTRYTGDFTAPAHVWALLPAKQAPEGRARRGAKGELRLAHTWGVRSNGYCWRIRLGRVKPRIPLPLGPHLPQVSAKTTAVRIRQ